MHHTHADLLLAKEFLRVPHVRWYIYPKRLDCARKGVCDFGRELFQMACDQRVIECRAETCIDTEVQRQKAISNLGRLLTRWRMRLPKGSALTCIVQ